MILEHFSASASLQRCRVIVSVSASLEQLFCPHLRRPPPASQGHEDEWVTPTKELFKPPVCNMSVYCMSVCWPACLSARCVLVYFSYSLSVCRFSFLSACLCACQPSSCSTNYLSPCLLTCLPACQWIHMLFLVLSQQLDSIPTTTRQTVFTLYSDMPFSHLSMLWHAYCTGL